MPYYDDNQNPRWEFDLFAKGIAHEYAHCFVNPIVEAHKCELKDMETFFKSIEKFVELLKEFEQTELLFKDFYPDAMKNFQL